jgi:hypothetical protein
MPGRVRFLDQVPIGFYDTTNDGGGGGNPGGPTGSIQYNYSGSLSGSSNMVWDNPTNTLILNGDINANNINVSQSFTASGLIYPTADNGEESFIQTDGNGNLSLQYVKTVYEEIINGELTQLVKGTPVYVSGSQGAASIVYRADAANPAKMPVIYITADTLDPGGAGKGIALGLIKGINTTGYPAGTEIYVAAGGGWTSTRPTGDKIIQVLGYVTKEGNGGQGVVLNPGPANLPNIPSGSVWTGNSGSFPTPVPISSLSVATASFATTASYVAWGNIGGDINNQTDLSNYLSGYVPYSGANADVNLGTYKLLTPRIEGTAFSSNIQLGSAINIVASYNTYTLQKMSVGSGDMSAMFGVRGNSATTGTAFLVQNSTPQTMFEVFNNSTMNLNGTTSFTGTMRVNNISPLVNGDIILRNTWADSTGVQIRTIADKAQVLTVTPDTTNVRTSGNSNILNILNPFAPTSGNGVVNAIGISGTINQTGGANGTIRGVYYNPTITSVLGTHNAWESTSGNMVLSSGNISITNLISGVNRTGFYGSAGLTLAGYYNGANNLAEVNISSDFVVRVSGSVNRTIFANNGAFTISNQLQSTTYLHSTSTGTRIGNSTAVTVATLEILGASAVTGTAFLVRNSTPTDLFKLENNGNITYGTAGSGRYQYNLAASTHIIDRGVLSILYNGISPTISIGTFVSAATAGTRSVVDLSPLFAPTSGTAITNFINIGATINQTGGANGIVRGIYIAPTLTSAADWRSIEWSNNTGFGLYGAGAAPNYLSGSLGIGTTSPATGLDVSGSGRFTNGLTITGSLIVTGGITGSLQGTSSWANDATTASYTLQALSASFASTVPASGVIGLNLSQIATASFTASVSPTQFTVTSASITEFTVTGTGVTIGNVITDTHTVTGSLNISGSVTATSLTSSTALISGSGTNRLIVVGSGSAQPIFTVQGSQGELFSVTDSLSGSLFSVNDISGLPILEVFSDNTTLIGSYLDPMLITTTKLVTTASGAFILYSLPTASYDTAFFEYSIKSGSNARAGTIMAIQSGTSVNFTETTTTDFGSTSGFGFSVQVSAENMILTGSATTSGWTIKTIIRGI